MTDFGNQIAMTRFIAEVRDAEVVARDIPPSLGSEETVPGGKKSFASGSQRLAALLRYVWHKKHDDGYHAHEVSADRLHLRSLARQVMTLMRADGVNQRFWRDVNGLQKNYYCYKLEALAEGSHTSLSGCMDSWAANLLMQEGFKASRQAETRRVSYIFFAIFRQIVNLYFVLLHGDFIANAFRQQKVIKRKEGGCFKGCG